MKQVRTPSDVPDGPHFAVFIYNTTSVYIEGDERSRTYPGHGYPAHTERYDTFEHWVTQDLKDLEVFILKNQDKLNKIVCIDVSKRVNISSKVVVSIE